MALNSNQSKKSVVVSAPAKIHLMGEHAVVYGKPALLAAISWRLCVTVNQNKKGLKIICKENPYLVKKAVEIVRKNLRVKLPLNITIKIESQIPAGKHIGSSAALSVAVVAALVYYFRKTWDLEYINKLAFETEKYQHKNPSGGDNTVVAYGGTLWYRKELDFLKSMVRIPILSYKNLAHFFLIDTGRPKETTGDMVKMVTSFTKLYPKKAERLFNENEKAVKDITQALKENNEKLIIKSIQNGERTLEKLGVVSKKIIPIVRKIEKSGGAAKILGGGGKTGAVGFLLCYHRNLNRVKELLKNYYYTIYPIKIENYGVRLESKI